MRGKSLTCRRLRLFLEVSDLRPTVEDRELIGGLRQVGDLPRTEGGTAMTLRSLQFRRPVDGFKILTISFAQEIATLSTKHGF